MLVATIGFEPISHDYKSCALPIELYRYEAQVFVFRPHARRSRPWPRALQVTVILSCSAGKGLPPLHSVVKQKDARLLTTTGEVSLRLSSATAEHIRVSIANLPSLAAAPFYTGSVSSHLSCNWFIFST